MNRSAGSGLSSLISLVFFYFFLIILLVLFAGQVLNSENQDNELYLVILWFAALIVPVVLLFSIFSNLLRLLRERRDNAPGSVLKTRLIIYFLIMVILSAGPQAALSLSFIRVIGDTWFNDEIGEALENSLDITVNIQQTLSSELEEFAFSSLFENLSERAGENPARYFVQLSQIRPSLDALQIFDSEGEMLYFNGDEEAAIEYSSSFLQDEGLVIRDVRRDRSFIRILRNISSPERDLSIILIEELPRGFGEKTLKIVSALELFSQYREIKDLLFTGIIIFYGVFSLPLVFLAILAGFYLSDVLIRPIVNLEQATRRVAEGDFSFRILGRSREELGHLVESFNGMIAELERSRTQLVQSERVSAWKDIAQRLAHEIKNPLTPIKLSAERLKRKYEREGADFPRVLENSVATITREVDHLAGLLTEFRDFARLPYPQPREVSLKQLIQDVLDVHRIPHVDVILEHIQDDTMVFVDPAQFRQVLGNLVKNAVEAIGQNPGELRFESQILSSSGKRFQRIQIKDDGEGMDEETSSQIFNPYFTSKAGGTGLGLAIVQRIIQDHGGEIRVESEPGMGARFYIDLPILEQ
ncbi:sensor histidine kinase [Salinispira pacifica]|uniref:histidine kinase n=1 Tax=Salinispira pacifica TaxID=1307761 RepID=V5WLB8_9SPIO|nr:ATP-binding protein [Salinispira pacifica]AHC16632.1 hypothetical protein L21SP2_3292 [Salinispira pacifica]